MKNGVTAIIVAGGKGTRMGSEIPKQYLTLSGKTILDITLYKFEKNNYVDEIILVVSKDEKEYVEENISCNYSKISHVVTGGSSRTESVYNGLNAAKGSDIVLIHDAVRPFVSQRLINETIEKAKEFKACVPVLDIVDTVKHVEDGFVSKTLDRNPLKLVQTPQAFSYELIKMCYDMAMTEVDAEFSDDSSIVEYYGHKVKVVEGLYKNFKITTHHDLRMAEILESVY